MTISKERIAPDQGLGEPKMRFEDTFSAETVVLEMMQPQIDKDQWALIELGIDVAKRAAAERKPKVLRAMLEVLLDQVPQEPLVSGELIEGAKP